VTCALRGVAMAMWGTTARNGVKGEGQEVSHGGVSRYSGVQRQRFRTEEEDVKGDSAARIRWGTAKLRRLRAQVLGGSHPRCCRESTGTAFYSISQHVADHTSGSYPPWVSSVNGSTSSGVWLCEWCYRLRLRGHETTRVILWVAARTDARSGIMSEGSSLKLSQSPSWWCSELTAHLVMFPR
jgi:hypothetical protein